MSLNPSIKRPSPAQLRAIRSRLQLLIRDAGQTDLSPAAAHAHAPYWHLEPLPLVLAADEWQKIEEAVQQRARFVNAFLVDVYRDQEVLLNQIIPPEVVLSDPYYRRPCLKLDTKRLNPATVLRFDLIRTPDGWMFTDTRANTPVGVSFAVQNRRFLSQEASELYGALPDYHSIVNFPLQILDTLHGLSTRTGPDTSVVVLTAGPKDPFYAEHSFLARKMGLPLAQGDDLLVLDNRVYFKTIAGLERVDVIYRRLNDAHIDPVVFSTDRETAGVPGLLQCIRSGNVVIANSIGSGLAESRSLDAYLPKLMRFYLGEKPLLPSVPTYTCGDVDHLDIILDTYADLRIRPIHDPRIGSNVSIEPLPFLVGPQGLAPQVAQNPFKYVAQKSVTHQALDPLLAHSPGFTLSVFALTGETGCTVMPGGLVHIGSGEPPRDRVGVTADAIVVQPKGGQTEETRTGDDDNAAVPQQRVLGSRAAESLLWLGRYLERAEATARMLQIFDDVALEEIPARERHRWLPIWRGLFEATGHDTEANPSRNPTSLSTEQIWRMTLDAQHPSSFLASISIAAENARQLRDYVSPEAWAILSRLHARLSVLRRPDSGTTTPAESPSNGANDLRRKNAQQAIQAVTNEINAFLGTAERTMLHDAGWQFLHMGAQLERAIMTTSALRHVLVFLEQEFLEEDGPGKPRENPELSALLRMLGSQDAYRRLYQTRTQPHLVANLFLQQPDAPRSVYHNLRKIRQGLDAIQQDIRDETSPASVEVVDILRFLAEVHTDAHFHARSTVEESELRDLDTILSELLEKLFALHPVLSDHYFSHQSRIPTPVAQGEFAL